MPPTILLATLGTHGDVAPFLALGQALQHAGARPILLINPAERPWVEQAGLEAVWVGEPYDVREELRKRPAYLSSLRGGTLVMREIFVPAAETFYTATREAIQQHKPAAVVAHIALAGPVWAAREADVPLAMAHLTPLTFANPADLGHYGRATRAGLRLALPIAIRGFAHFFGIAAKRLGLPREWATFDQTVLGGDAQLGMWSPTFRPPAPGDPPGAI
ncbi:MAG: glycosyltransferase, partial [Phycisphaeraceae bacterium]